MAIDLLSLGLGFLSGAVAGAAGNYLSDRFTDARRIRQERLAADRAWEGIEKRFPNVVAEMRADFATNEGKTVRAFFLKTKGSMIGLSSEPAFEYHTDVHVDARAAVLHLEREGFISQLPAGCPMYRVHECLVDRLLGRKV